MHTLNLESGQSFALISIFAMMTLLSSCQIQLCHCQCHCLHKQLAFSTCGKRGAIRLIHMHHLEVLSYFIVDGGEFFAMAAPRCIKLDQHSFSRIIDNTFKALSYDSLSRASETIRLRSCSLRLSDVSSIYIISSQ